MLARKPILAVADVGGASVPPGSGARLDGDPSSSLSAQLAADDRGFVALDSWLSSAGAAQRCAPGVAFRAVPEGRGQPTEGIVVVTCDAASVEAVADHVARRLGEHGRVVRASGGSGGDGWRQIAALLADRNSQRGTPLSSREVASAVVAALAPGLAPGEMGPASGELAARPGEAAQVAAIVVAEGEPSRFSGTVAAEIDAFILQAAAATGAAGTGVAGTGVAGTGVAGTGGIVPVVWIVPAGSDRARAALPRARRFEVDGLLEPAAIEAWWRAASTEPLARDEARLHELERWWRVARHVSSWPVEAAEERGAVQMLALAARPWPVAQLASLGVSQEEARDLVARGLADVRDGAITLRAIAASACVGRGEDGNHADTRPSVDAALVQRAASALEKSFGRDPWAIMRAGELCLSAGLIERGDALSLRAIADVVDAEARMDFWSRFAAASPSPSPGAARLLPFVDVALRKGDGDYALKFARDAMAYGDQDPSETPRTLLALGRALAVSGDLSAASRTLSKVVESDPVDTDPLMPPRSAATRLVAARACVELAEARYYSSDLPGARAAAEDAVRRLSALSGPSELHRVSHAGLDPRECAVARLDARNVLGKLLLARGEFVAAEDHFASDACEASVVHQPVSELRARVNRAIAVMSLGRRAEAQSILEAVLAEAESANELKAIGISLINLAALAIVDRRYGEALELSERAVEVLRRIGDKVALSRCVANLAELRVRIGLVDEAAQAVRFGGRVLRGGVPPEQASRFALILAKVALTRADTSGAQHHVRQALAALGASTCLEVFAGAPAGSLAQPSSEPQHAESRGPVGEHVSEALRLAARIALDDGDNVRAAVFIERAEAERAPQQARADLAVLRVLLARSKGEPFDQLATEALRVCREADDDELLREAHLLLYRAAFDQCQRQAADAPAARFSHLEIARHHLNAALAMRDRIAECVPENLKTVFLRRPDLEVLAREVVVFDELQVTLRSSWLRTEGRASGAGASLFSDIDALSPMTSRSPSTPPLTGAVLTGGALANGMPRRIVGEDVSIRSLLNAIRKVGPADAIVLIQGESGTGKELVAEALHEASTRRTGPLVKVNCAALVETLLLSELFGHEKGAFTGAAGRRRGRFEAAEGGTLFLDEIGDISPRTQVALLRVLQEKTFERVGGTSSIRANVRVVCATHRNLKALVARGEFREDLYYRLCGVTLEVPALRARLGDLGAVADAILRRIAEERGGSVKRLSPRALVALKSHTWPGNIRELENALRAASLFAEGELLEPEDFADNVESLRHISETLETLDLGERPTPVAISGLNGAGAFVRASVAGPGIVAGTDNARNASMPSGSSIGAPASVSSQPPGSAPVASDVAYAQVRAGVSLHDMKRMIERECIARALTDASGNITRAATLLGMKRPRLSQLVKQYGLAAADAEDGSELGVGATSANEEEE